MYTIQVVDLDKVGYTPTVVGANYGRTTCDDVCDPQGSRTSSPPTNYTQDYPLDLEQLALQNGTVLTPDRIGYVGENVVNGVNYPYNKPKTGFAPQYPLNPTTPFSPQ